MRLVVGYLATSGGADAMALAVRLARTLAADVEVRLVLAPDDVAIQRVTPDRYHEVLAEQGATWLDEALRMVPDDVTARGEVLVDASVADALCAEAQRLDAEVLVVGGSGGGLVGSLALGALVDELLRTAPVPVAVAPRGTRHGDAQRIRSVTCAVGDRPGARRLLDTAVRVSTATRTPLRLVSLVALDQIDDRAADTAHQHARQTLDEVTAALPDGVDVTAVVATGDTVEAAVEGLQWQDGDVLMLGSSRLAPPRRLMLGSTAARILRVLQVPILVTPGEEAPTPA